MPEIILHYIWQQGIAKNYPQFTTDGRKVEIIDAGKHNLDAGPDFRDARLRIYTPDGTQYVELVGNVEIHVLSSEWFTHKHQFDPAYDNIIMHVVKRADKQVFNSQGEAPDQMELSIPGNRDWVAEWLHTAKGMDDALMTHRCGVQLLKNPGLLTENWKQTMLIRRLKCKTESIERLLAISLNDWRQALYISLAHYFGFHTNGVPFEKLAKQTPLAVLNKHRNDLFQLEAILLGQSGLIEPPYAVESDEIERLRQEYGFLQHKFGLQPIAGSLWKRGRMRPQNAPETRLRQFAKLVYSSEFLFSNIIETADINALRELFGSTGMGRDSIDILLINVVVPFKYAYGHKEQALDLIRTIPAENNRIIRQWQTLGQEVHSAADSQALIHLYQTCCEEGKCMDCDVYSPIL